ALPAGLVPPRPLPPPVAFLRPRLPTEPCRLVLSLAAADLEAASRDDMTTRLLDEAPHQAHASASDLRDVLDLVAQAVPAPLAADQLHHVRAQVETFGLHAARLDIREDAGRLAVGLGGILGALGIDSESASRGDEARTALALRLLTDLPP